MLNWHIKKKLRKKEETFSVADTVPSNKNNNARMHCVYASPEMMSSDWAALPSQERYPFSFSESCQEDNSFAKVPDADPKAMTEGANGGREWNPDATLCKCKYCGQWLPVWAKFCLSCGKKLH